MNHARYLPAACTIVLLTAGLHGICAEQKPAPFKPTSVIDELLIKGLAQKGLQPATICSDEVFLRRVFLDLIGTIPTPAETRTFLKQADANKRARLIDYLMRRPEFPDYWTLKWCDLLRVKAEFPINLWPNGAQAYGRWIYDAVDSNMPYDAFARALLTSNGSNFRVPPVNFYRAVQGTKPSTLAAAVALTFMGTRLDTWSEVERSNLEAFFSRVAFKGTAEWKEVIVYPDPAQVGQFEGTLPDGRAVKVPGSYDPRVVFTKWLLDPGNAWFAKNVANRTWSWFFGYGLIHEPDDIRPDNPAVHPEILAFLEKELVAGKYDLRHLFRVIVNSSAYQQSCVPRESGPDTDRWFARYPPRQLAAEVLLDALGSISGQHEEYSSAIPEPFTFIPKQNRNITLIDGSITSPFLKMFGRPARDTGLESERTRFPTREQRLLLINSTHIHNKITRSWKLLGDKRNPGQITELMYLTILARFPTPREKELAEQHLASRAGKQGRTDLIWALLNTKEFLYQH